MLTIQFHGAAREVTGSCHLLYVDRRPTLLDCGLCQGRRADAREKNLTFPVDPATIHSVILSHAHIDHSGNLPQLARQGFTGPIYSTGATAQLSQYMLRDSARIQESDTEYLNKKRAKKGEPPLEPLYILEDADEALSRFIGMPYHRPFHVLRKLRATFHNAGHLLGAAGILLEAEQKDGSVVRLGFSGDVGRKTHPFLLPPEPIEELDYLILESTYGNRFHDEEMDLRARLLEIVQRVVERGSKLLIPAFALGRTQLIVYHLNALWNEGKLPRIPVYVDSPLSADVTEIYRQRYECCDEATRALLLKDDDPFGFDSLTYVREAEHSKKLNAAKGPMIVISAAGMCEAGRILHHLKHGVGDPKNIVLIVGYMAEDTLGRKLLQGDKKVRILSDDYVVKCEVESLEGFSAHGDQTDLSAWAMAAARGGRLKKVFLVHGEQPSLETLRDLLAERLNANRAEKSPEIEVLIPSRGDRFDLAKD
jgi:metallo-beta-lactamase family protein